MRVTIWVTGAVYQVGCANSMARSRVGETLLTWKPEDVLL
jgi:hypothetical protein